jgi:hypothetical protein
MSVTTTIPNPWPYRVVADNPNDERRPYISTDLDEEQAYYLLAVVEKDPTYTNARIQEKTWTDLPKENHG